MTQDELQTALSYVEYGENAWRLKVIDADDVPCILFNPHGLSVKATKKAINGTICLIHTPFRMEICHGYNSGTAIKEMLYKTKVNPRISKIKSLPNNPGYSLLDIA